MKDRTRTLSSVNMTIFTLLAIMVIYSISLLEKEKTKDFSTSHQYSSISSLQVSGLFKVEIVPGNGRLILTGNKSDIDIINTRFDNGHLSISQKEGLLLQRGIVSIRIESNYIHSLTFRGNINAISTSPKIRNIYTSGTSTINLERLNVKILKLRSEGSNHLIIKGQSLLVEVDTSGSSTLDLSHLKMNRIDGSLKGSSSVSIPDKVIENLQKDGSYAITEISTIEK